MTDEEEDRERRRDEGKATFYAVMGSFQKASAAMERLASQLELVQKIVASDSRVLSDPEPFIAVSELADSSVNLVVRP